MSINARSGLGSFTWHETIKKCCGASNRISWNRLPRSASAGKRLACLAGFGQPDYITTAILTNVGKRLACLAGFGQPRGGVDMRGGAVCHIRAVSAGVKP